MYEIAARRVNCDQFAVSCFLLWSVMEKFTRFCNSSLTTNTWHSLRWRQNGYHIILFSSDAFTSWLLFGFGFGFGDSGASLSFCFIFIFRWKWNCLSIKFGFLFVLYLLSFFYFQWTTWMVIFSGISDEMEEMCLCTVIFVQNCCVINAFVDSSKYNRFNDKVGN